MPCFVTLSQNALHRLEAVQKVREHRLTVTQAAELLRLSRSQVHRLLQAYDRDGADGLASKKRGRPSNRRHSETFRNAALDLVRDHYPDFGPTLACEKLLERHQPARRQSCGVIFRRAAPDAARGASGGVMAADSARN